MLLIFGAGYSGTAVARAAVRAGIAVAATRRGDRAGVAGVDMVPFAAAGAAIAAATHVLVTVPPQEGGPDENGDPVLAAYGAALAAAPGLRWVGYLSTTGVYGDRGGGWVDEGSVVAPGNARSVRRVAAEKGWAALGARVAVDVFRVGGIYGPGRSPFDDLKARNLQAGRARRVDKPGHAFGRVHRDDIAGAVLAAMGQHRHAGMRVLHLVDDLPAESGDVVAEAARLLGVVAPDPVPFAEAWATMSPMARSFWAENKKVSSVATQAALGYRWTYPDYRAGLAAILAEEGVDGSA